MTKDEKTTRKRSRIIRIMEKKEKEKVKEITGGGKERWRKKEIEERRGGGKESRREGEMEEKRSGIKEWKEGEVERKKR